MLPTCLVYLSKFSFGVCVCVFARHLFDWPGMDGVFDETFLWLLSICLSVCLLQELKKDKSKNLDICLNILTDEMEPGSYQDKNLNFNGLFVFGKYVCMYVFCSKIFLNIYQMLAQQPTLKPKCICKNKFYSIDWDNSS